MVKILSNGKNSIIVTKMLLYFFHFPKITVSSKFTLQITGNHFLDSITTIKYFENFIYSSIC